MLTLITVPLQCWIEHLPYYDRTNRRQLFVLFYLVKQMAEMECATIAHNQNF